jgi:hypothetical protein
MLSRPHLTRTPAKMALPAANLWGTRPEPVDTSGVDRAEQLLRDKINTLAGYNKPPEQIAQQVFTKFDTDKSGCVTIDEFIKAMESLNFHGAIHEQRALYNRFDLNGDGKIPFKEFSEALFGGAAQRKTLTIGKVRLAVE